MELWKMSFFNYRGQSLGRTSNLVCLPWRRDGPPASSWVLKHNTPLGENRQRTNVEIKVLCTSFKWCSSCLEINLQGLECSPRFRMFTKVRLPWNFCSLWVGLDPWMCPECRRRHHPGEQFSPWPGHLIVPPPVFRVMMLVAGLHGRHCLCQAGQAQKQVGTPGDLHRFLMFLFRTNTVMFSKKAVICQRNGSLYLQFR